MATASKVTTGISNTHTLTTDNGDTVILSSLVDLLANDTGSDLDGSAGVRADRQGLVVVDALEALGPDGQSARTDGATVEVVAGVLDNETQVQHTGKVDGELDMGHVLGVDHIRGESAQGAGTSGIL